MLPPGLLWLDLIQGSLEEAVVFYLHWKEKGHYGMPCPFHPQTLSDVCDCCVFH